MLEVDDLARSYGPVDVFDSVTFAVERGERLLVMGLNGAGKTSLLRILAGVAEPDLGSVRYGHQVDFGYYAQEHDLIDPSRSLLEQMREHATVGDTELRGLLGMFGLSGDIVFRPAGTLSGGEKTKLVLAQLVAGRHNLLFLDEPTNNLDPGSRRGHGRGARRRGRGRWSSSATTASSSRCCSPTGCSSCPRPSSTTGTTSCSTWSPWPDRDRPRTG